MGLLNFGKARAEPKKTANLPATGRVSTTGSSVRYITGYKSRTENLLEELRRRRNVYDAIELICEKHPDANMALTSILRLANSGNKMEMRTARGGRDEKLEKEWRQFASRVNGLSNEGLDGLINQLHKSAMMFGGMAGETVVRADLSDIEDVYLILPQSINWEYDDKTGQWVPWQYNGIKKVDLRTGNFFWVSFDGKVGLPTGTLMYESALQPIDYQLQFYSDTAAVLRRVGYPRNDVAINLESVMANAPQDVKNDAKKQQQHLRDYFEWIKETLRSLEPTDDLVHYDDLKVSATGGDNSRTIDLRAYNEMVDPQVLNGLSCLAVLANRTTGVTETWGTVQFKIVTQTIQSLQRGSKRFIENVARIWLQVRGRNDITPIFEHNPVDWETEKTKLDCQNTKLEVYRRAEEYGYVDAKTAAVNAMGVSELPKEQQQLNGYEYIQHFPPAPTSTAEPSEPTPTNSDDGN